MCPTDALTLNMDDRTIVFDVDKCSACGMCTRVCPVKCMTLDMEENGRP
jgi:ferredoxin